MIISRDEKLALFRKIEHLTSRETDIIFAEERGEVLREKLVLEMDEELMGLWKRVKNLSAHRTGGEDSEILKVLAREWLKRNDPTEKAVEAQYPKGMKTQFPKSANRGSANLEKDPVISRGQNGEENSAVYRRAVPLSIKVTTSKVTTSSIGVTKPRGRYIRPAVKRAVWQRDQGKCTNCGSQYAIELDHRRPFAHDGEHTVENLRLLCRSCNQSAAVQAFGVHKIAKEVQRSKNL